MIGDELVISTEKFDLVDDVQVALTIQAFDLTSVPSVKTTVSNQFKLPGTNRNHRLLGYPNIEYFNISRQLIRNVLLKSFGLITIDNASLNVLSFDGEFYNVALQTNAKNFWDALDNKYLTDLDTKSINGQWSNARRDAQRANTTDLSSAIISTGQLLAGTPVDNFTNGQANPPIIYLSYIINKIFDMTGFSKFGAIFADPGYLRTVIPCTFQFDPDWLRKKEFSAAADGTQFIGTTPGSETVVKFQNVQTQGDDNFYNPATGEWTVVNPDTGLNYFSCGFYNKMGMTVVGANVDVLLKKNGTILASTLNVGTSTTENGTIDAGYGPTKGFKAGDIVTCVIRGIGVSAVTINNTSIFYAKCFESSDDTKAFEDSYYHYFNYMLPKISLKQIFIELIMQYNLVSSTDASSSTVSFVRFNDLANTLSTNWSNKVSPLFKTAQNYIPSCAQNNYFKWLAGDLKDIEYKGNIEVSGDKLPLETTYYQSSFEATKMHTTRGIFGASMDLWGTVSFIGLTNIRARMLMVRDRDVSEPSVRFDAVGRTDYKICYFSDPHQFDYNLDWQFLIDRNYNRYAYALNNYRMVEKTLMLSVDDVRTFNPFLPVIIDSNTYVVNRIYQYMRGQLVKVQLFKI